VLAHGLDDIVPAQGLKGGVDRGQQRGRVRVGRPSATAFAKVLDAQQARAVRSASRAGAALKEPRVADACGFTFAIPTSNQAPADAG
jgi:hypothetical protein